MANEEVGSEELEELLGGQMVSYIGKANPGRDSACPSEGAKQRGLGDAEAFPASHDVAGPVVFRTIEGSIRIVKNSITNREIKLNGFFHGIVKASRHLMCIVANDGVVAVYDRCWSKKILHVRQPSTFLFVNDPGSRVRQRDTNGAKFVLANESRRAFWVRPRPFQDTFKAIEPPIYESKTQVQDRHRRV
jgi:hypothetical protein